MPLDFRNTNTLWASILVETLQRLGLTTAVICPGSRSTPLAIAFARHDRVEAISVLDERSAGFFALGIARQKAQPVVIVCTSGTAGANFYPAVIEARESRVPLLVLTGDRPPELRDCHSGQTIDQVKLYGHYPNWQAELATPSLEMSMLAYLRQTAIHAWERSLFPVPGPVHVNIPFRDPLAPLPQPAAGALMSQFQPEDFFGAVSPLLSRLEVRTAVLTAHLKEEWLECERGIIIAGVTQPQQPQEYCQAIAHLCKSLGWPVLAEGLSPVRNYAQLNPYVISTYDLILRNRHLAQQLKPAVAIQVGDLPTSKELRTWLESTQPRRWAIDPSYENLDPLHGKTSHLRLSAVEMGLGALQNRKVGFACSEYLQLWYNAETKVRAAVDGTMAAMEEIIEPKVGWLLSQVLPPATPIFIANSMPVRDVEFFWAPNNSGIQPYFNRGANGIDGTLSTALGVAHRNQSSVMLTGDLALLHDTNGFLLRNKFVGHLTIVVINNNGGGIFEMLPVAEFEPPFEEFFATPQDIDFAQLCCTYNVGYNLISSWEQLARLLNPLPERGIRVLEVRTSRKADSRWRRENLGNFAGEIRGI
ncbi:MAG: 2-succinyl-5-enolpyruvyl-6-hydroxy-3-cyclohexene-1-carboxylic-acid synthase [Oscillatoria princeps RMCB-10]|jgi:2-succinyl-5-enolpyruvyl-6-hydroxy-3-cyclohexene-1-carboxylate synthase|nr:2-succinyl-5-enolpyruvyl-6-hydroxy-3-cyclohexene-1-carboxylic-acid synthase [Oscillatoria princeps RMCB-10]